MAEANEPAYVAVIEALWSELKPRMVAFMERLRQVVKDAGHPCSEVQPEDSGEEYAVEFATLEPGSVPDDDADVVSFRLTLCEQRQRDYSEEGDFGITFDLSIVEWGGRILGGMSPFNYTDQVWVDARDAAAVAARWALMEAADLDTVPNLLDDR